MKRHYILLVGLILLTCGCDDDDYANEPLITIDPIVGLWEEVLDDSSQYDSIVWTFTADGLMTLNFDDNNLASGEWIIGKTGVCFVITHKFLSFWRLNERWRIS